MEGLVLFFVVFLLAGLIGEFLALRIPNTIVHLIVLAISFILPWIILRPMGMDLLVAFVAWGIGAVLAYALTRGRVV